MIYVGTMKKINRKDIFEMEIVYMQCSTWEVILFKDRIIHEVDFINHMHAWWTQVVKTTLPFHLSLLLSEPLGNN